ncbi:MAG: hypothetical protein LBH25_12655 [Fibromonadaceae bacterium]|jgi:hypothetical protein|nr:hypothetical protein [Fibromonadaceae bacterium]
MRNKLTKITLAAGIALAMAFTLNACGPSKAELAIMAMPSIGKVSGLKNKLIWLQANVQSGGNYVIEIDADEIGYFSYYSGFSYKDKNNIAITLRGVGENRAILVSESGFRRFSVGSGVTVVLDENITLKEGIGFGALARVDSGGTLVMNDGSAITGYTRNTEKDKTYRYRESIVIHGAGVYVDDGGTFIMKGGNIYGNTIQPNPVKFIDPLSVPARNNNESFNVNYYLLGAGVYVEGSGTFIKTGGTITGYSSDQKNGNMVKDVEGNVLSNFGHAIAFGTPANASKGKEPITIDTTIGPEITLNFSNGVLKKGKSEEAQPPESE